MVVLVLLNRPKMNSNATSNVNGSLQTWLAGLKPDDDRWLLRVEAPHRQPAGIEGLQQCA
jgi:hypothetical protein